MFDDCVEYIRGKRISAAMQIYLNRGADDDGDDDSDSADPFPKYMGKWCNIDGAESVLEFLDYYFTYCVEWAPAGRAYYVNFCCFSLLNDILSHDSAVM